MPLLKLNQHVNIAIGAKIIPQNRAEERQFANVITTAKLRDLVVIYFNVRTFHPRLETQQFTFCGQCGW
jgi:hypothetical protein